MKQALNTLACQPPQLIVYADQASGKILATYPVSSYSLQKAINTITMAQIRLASGTSIKTPKTTCDPYVLYSRYMKRNELQYAQLTQQLDGKQVLLLAGYITTINPSITTDSEGTTASYTVALADSIMKLQLKPLSDFVYANAATINDNVANTQTISVQNNLTRIGQPGEALFTPVNNVFSVLNITQRTSILNIAALTIQYLMQLSTGVLVDENNRPYKNQVIDIRDYIEGSFYLCDYYISAQVASPYILQMQNLLASGLMRGSIWQILIQCLCRTDRLCQISPAPISILTKQGTYKLAKYTGNQQASSQQFNDPPKYKLTPAALVPGKAFKMQTLTQARITGVKGMVTPGELLNRPQLFYVSYQDLNYSAGKDVVQTDLAGARWGKYIPPQAESRLKAAGKDGTSQLFKRTLRPAPAWLNLLSTSKFNTDNITLESPSVAKQPVLQATAKIATGTIQATEVQPLYDNYAKALFCALYKGNDSAAIGLLPTLQNLMLDQHIGQCIQVDVKVNKSNANDAMNIHFMGAMYSYSLSYSPNGGFSLQIGIRFVRDPSDASAVASPLYSATANGPSFDSQRPKLQK